MAQAGTNLDSPLLNVEQLARLLGVPKGWVYQRTAKGHADPLPFMKVGGYLRFRQVDIERWLESHQGDAEPEWSPDFAAGA